VYAEVVHVYAGSVHVYAGSVRVYAGSVHVYAASVHVYAAVLDIYADICLPTAGSVATDTRAIYRDASFRPVPAKHICLPSRDPSRCVSR
jgi:hypothetical protein